VNKPYRKLKLQSCISFGRGNVSEVQPLKMTSDAKEGCTVDHSILIKGVDNEEGAQVVEIVNWWITQHPSLLLLSRLFLCGATSFGKATIRNECQSERESGRSAQGYLKHDVQSGVEGKGTQNKFALGPVFISLRHANSKRTLLP